MISSLYAIFKKWSAKGSVYIISDPHFSDKESFEFRSKNNKLPDNIKTVTDLDNFIISNINKVAHKNDCLIILGDVGNIECVTKLKAGYKVLLLGNHDRGADYYKRTVTDITNLKTILANAIKFPKDLLMSEHELDNHVICDNKLFDEVYPGPLMISDKIILSHEPIIPCPDYLVNLCGHVHDKDHKFKIDNHQYYNFCAEAIDYKPISLGELIKDGLLSKVKDIHRVTVDGAIDRKKHRAKR